MNKEIVKVMEIIKISKSSKQGGSNRKKGRDLVKCKRYRLENRKMKNKARRLIKRWRNYKIQPPLALNGLKNNNELFHMVKTGLEK